MDVWHHDDDEGLVRSVLQYAFPSERPIFSQRRGAQIIRAAAVEALEQPRRRHPFAPGRLAACLAATLFLLAGTVGVAGAALPGEPLYPIKRAVERAMVAITGDDIQAARLELQFAERRLEEAAALVDDPTDEPPPEVAESFDAHLDAAVTLGGEAVATEVAELERGRGTDAHDEAATRTAEGTSSADADAAQAADVEPAAENEPGTVVPELSADPTPTPAADPTPSTSASPSPGPDDEATPAPTDGPTPGPEEPRPSAPVDDTPGSGLPGDVDDGAGNTDPLSDDYNPLPNGVPGPHRADDADDPLTSSD